MIEDKLEEARLHSARRRMQIVIAGLATICVVGLGVFVLSLIDFSARDNSLIQSASKEISSLSDKELVRTEFKENLLQYENQFEPRLKTAGLETWNREGLFELTELKKEMLLYFSNGEYSKATENLQLLNKKATNILEEAENIYTDNMKKTAVLLEDDLYDEAKLHIEKALSIHSQSSEALALKKEIEKLPFILPLIEGAKVARTENDLQKEYGLLQQIVKLAPQRQEEAARMRVLAELITTQNFETHISSGFAAIEKAQLEEARYHYQEARRYAPQREELPLLAKQISVLEKSLRIRKHIKQAEQAVSREDWSQARESFLKAAADAPENNAVIEGLHQVEDILGLLDRFDQHLNNPYRLSNSSVRIDAENVLAEAKRFSGSSSMLQSKSGQLREMISAVNRVVPVTIISDNQTSIEIRGVGKVGMVSEKTIQLKPGMYTFEGSRNGFKSKLVQAFITYDLESYGVQIVCDEHI